MSKVIWAMVGLAGILAAANLAAGMGWFGRSQANLTVIATPFGGPDGSGNWTGEVGPYMKELCNQTQVVDILDFCEYAFTGNLGKQKVLVVVSGVGKVRTTGCLTQVMQVYGPEIKEVILSGIAGIVPQNGAKVGDVCINSVSADFDLQYYTADNAGSNTANPVFWNNENVNPAARIGFEPSLAQELATAAAAVDWPEAPEAMQAVNRKYGFEGGNKTWGLDECAEIAGDLFWHDRKSGVRAVELAAEVLNRPQKHVIAMTSMEATAVGNVVRTWNKNTKSRVKFAYVRAASNFSQPPVNGLGYAVENGRDSVLKSFDGTVEYAAQSAAGVVIKTLEMR